MPVRPARLCKHVGCDAITTNRLCDVHQATEHRDKAQGRDVYHRWYSMARWRQVRLIMLANNPLCNLCVDPNPATIVDHIVPHKGNYDLFWDQSNYQSLCKMCHDKKTYSESKSFVKPKSLETQQKHV